MLFRLPKIKLYLYCRTVLILTLAWTREASLALSEEPRPMAVTMGNETTKRIGVHPEVFLLKFIKQFNNCII